MEWTEQELRELATFLARRMTTRLELIDPADPPAAGDPIGLWCEELKAAHESGRLAHLSRKISRIDPDDENLQKACDLLAESGGRNALQVMGAALSVGVFALVAGGAWMMAIPSATPLQPQSVTMARADITPDPIRAVETSTIARTALSTPVLELVAAAVESAHATHEPDVQVTHAPPALTQPVPVAPGCVTDAGEVVGYWYAGETPPGTEGELVTMPHAVNVRATFPHDSNGYDASGTVTCVLEEGDRVRLSKAPVRVAGGAWWVPLVTGDLETAEG